jgi:hypothetical protein
MPRPFRVHHVLSLNKQMKGSRARAGIKGAPSPPDEGQVICLFLPRTVTSALSIMALVKAITQKSTLPKFREAWEKLSGAETMLSLVPDTIGYEPVVAQLVTALEFIVCRAIFI